MNDDETEAPLVPPPSGFIGVLLRHKRPLFFAGLFWFGLVLCGGVYLSTIDARTGLHVFGSSRWTAGHESALRVSLRDLRLSMNRPLDQVEVRFVDVDGKEGPVFTLTQRAQGFVQGNVQAPLRPGRWTLHFRAVDNDTPLTARLGVDVSPRLLDSEAVLREIGAPKSYRLRDKSDPHEGGPLTLHLAPLDGVIPSGLEGQLILVVREAGHPRAAAVNLKVREGKSSPPLAETILVPESGFKILPVRAVHPVFHFELSTSDSKASRRVHPVSTQFSVGTKSTIVAPGDAEIEIKSLHQSGSVFIDLWRGDQWLSTTTTELASGSAKASIKIPKGDYPHDIVWLQVYRHAYMPGSARDGRYLLVTDGSRSEAARWLLEQLEAVHQHTSSTAMANDALMFASFAAADTQQTDTIRALMGRLPRATHSPPLLADSGETVIQTVSDLKATWQIRFVMALVISGILMFLFIGLVLYQNQREVERGWAMAGGADEGEQGTRKRLALEAGYLFLVLAIFLLGMIQLMLAIHW